MGFWSSSDTSKEAIDIAARSSEGAWAVTGRGTGAQLSLDDVLHPRGTHRL
jgi:hypothetical protein